MSDEFNPYRQWLNIPEGQRPASHYRLLGLRLFETSETAIREAAARVRAELRSYQGGRHTDAANQLLGELYVAETCLLDPQRRAAHDEQLRQNLLASVMPIAAPPASASGLPSAATPAERAAAQPSHVPATSAAAPPEPLKPSDFAPFATTPSYPHPGERSYGPNPSDSAPFAAAAVEMPAMATPIAAAPALALPLPALPGGTTPMAAAAAPPMSVPLPTAVPVSPPVAAMPGAYVAGSAPQASSLAASASPQPHTALPVAVAMMVSPEQACALPQALPVAVGTPAELASLQVVQPVETLPQGMIASPLPYAMAVPAEPLPPSAFATPMAYAIPQSAGALAAAPVAAVPGAARLAASAAAPVPGSSAPADPAMAAPAVRGGTARWKSKRQVSLVITVGAPVAAIVVMALLVAYLRGVGPFGDAGQGGYLVAQSPPGPSTPNGSQSGGGNSGAGGSGNAGTRGGPSDGAPQSRNSGPSQPHETLPRVQKSGVTVPQVPSVSTPPESVPAVGPAGTVDPPDVPQNPATTAPAVSKQPMASSEPIEAPPPDPTEPVGPDPQGDASAAQALMAARYFLAHRDLKAAADQLAAAARLPLSAARAAEAERVRMLYQYVEAFWKSVHESGNSLQSGEQITLLNGPGDKQITVGVVEVTPTELTLRVAGKNETYPYASMKSGLAFGLAERWLKKGDAGTSLALGAFLCVNPTSDRSDARNYWQIAASQGAADVVQLLMPELEVTIPQTLPNVPNLPASSEPADPTKPGPDGKYPVAGPDLLAQVLDEFKSRYEKQIASAATDPEKLVLANMLTVEANAEKGDPVRRFVLFQQARALLTAAHEYKMAFEVADALAAGYVVDPLQLKSETVLAAVENAKSADDQKKLALVALELADEAVLEEKFTEALRLARTAQAMALKAKDPKLTRDANARVKEITDQKKTAGS